MCLAGGLVQPRPADALRLEATPSHGHVSIEIAMPDVNGNGNVLEAEPPILGEESEVLGCCF